MVQKILAEQIFIDILNLCCNLDLEHSTPNFSQDTPTYDEIKLSRFCCKMISSSEDTAERINLVTKGYVVQKISAGQTIIDILNLRCDLDQEHSDQIFPQDTPAYNDVP